VLRLAADRVTLADVLIGGIVVVLGLLGDEALVPP
jgi:hypothetical protein